MTILYCCIARGTNVLCSNQTGTGSYTGTIENMLDNVASNKDGKKTFTASGNDYHCLIENGILYICVTETGVAKTQPFNFLQEIKRRFQSGPLCGKAMTAGPGDLDHDFNFVLSQQMKNFSKTGNSATNRLQSQVDEVKGVMSQNIEKVLDRGDKLDDLMDKTEELENSAANFQRTSRKISRRYWWKNKKMTLIIVGISLLVVIVLIIIILFSTHVLPPGSSSDDNQATTTKP